MRPDKREHITRDKTSPKQQSTEFHESITQHQPAGKGDQNTPRFYVRCSALRFLDVKVVAMLRVNRHTRIAWNAESDAHSRYDVKVAEMFEIKLFLKAVVCK